MSACWRIRSVAVRLPRMLGVNGVPRWPPLDHQLIAVGFHHRPTLTALISRLHVTSSRNAAEATLTGNGPVTFGAELDSKRGTKLKRKRLPANFVYRECPPEYRSATVAECGTTSQPLIMLFAWMQSKESHIEKYRQFWFKRGFNVFSVRTFLSDTLLPAMGGRKNAEIMYEFIANHDCNFEPIVVHTFSVGGYQWCEFLQLMERKLIEGDRNAEKVHKAIRGMIIDSCVFPQEAAPGLSRAFLKNPKMIWLMQKSIENFLKATKPYTYDRYLQVQRYLFDNRTKIPGLVLYSKTDLVSSIAMNQQMHQGWKDNGGLAEFKCWEKSPHVLHYKEHTDEYQEMVDQFISKLDLTQTNKRNKN